MTDFAPGRCWTPPRPDPKSQQPGMKPRGMRRKNRGAYSNVKLHRQTAIAAAVGKKRLVAAKKK